MQGACYRRFVSGTGLAGGDRQGPYRLVVRTSRCGRDNPGSTPGEDIVSAWAKMAKYEQARV